MTNEFAAPRLRPSLSRAILIYGSFKDNLAETTRAEAARLLAQSGEPLALYLRSRGGAVSALKIFEEILALKTSGGKPGQIMVVADGYLRSAASYFVVLGHYAYAEKHAWLGFHGVRYGQMHKLKAIMEEDALVMAMQLDDENRRIARRMAEAMIYRVAHRFADYQRQGGKSSENFFDHLRRHLTGKDSRSLLDDALVYAKMIPQLAGPQPAKQSRRLAAAQAKMLQALIACRLQVYRGKDQKFDGTAIAELMLDYLFLQDHLASSPDKLKQNLFKVFGTSFLTSGETARYQSLRRKSPRTAKTYLKNMANPRLASLWYYAASLGRRLLVHDVKLSPSDAYWLGLVDEVPGTPLTWQPLAGEVRWR
jgi:ATP-dependent protease ClpP protease subunit